MRTLQTTILAAGIAAAAIPGAAVRVAAQQTTQKAAAPPEQKSSIATTPPPASLRLQSFSVIVKDYDEAKSWYLSKLGFVALRDQAFGASERFVEVAPAGQKDFGIVLQLSHSTPTAAEPNMRNDYTDRIGKQVNIVLYSSDVAAYADTIRARGVTLTSPVQNMAWGSQVTFQDLYGNTLVVVGPASKNGKD